MFSIPYNTDFNYMNLKEVQNILEDTITLIFNALNFSIFHQLSLCELECDSNGIFSFDIELRDSVIVFDENTIETIIKLIDDSLIINKYYVRKQVIICQCGIHGEVVKNVVMVAYIAIFIKVIIKEVLLLMIS